MFQKGMAKTGGRKKGATNKASCKVLDQLLEEKLSPIDEILKLLPLVGPDKKIDVWLKLMSYCYPTLKAIEVTGESGEPIKVTSSNMAVLWQIARQQAVGTNKE